MIHKSIIAALLILSTLLSGCALKVKAPAVEVGLSGGSIHCPPGQAKKGKC